jgi:hypothetical protein
LDKLFSKKELFDFMVNNIASKIMYLFLLITYWGQMIYRKRNINIIYCSNSTL